MMGSTEPRELEMLRAHVPQLFTGGDMLYVGANQLRPPHHARTFTAAGWRLHLLEIFPGNVEHHQTTGIFTSITQGDIRTDPLPDEQFDVAFWWHGIEHIPQEDVAATVARLEDAAPFVVLGCPNGNSPQGVVYGNYAEEHQWSVVAADLEALGYSVVAYEPAGRRHLLAWKDCA